MSTMPVPVIGCAEAALASPDPQDAAVRTRIDQLKTQIDVFSATSVLNFGGAVEEELARFADTVLDQVMARDTGPVHAKLTEIRLIAGGLSVEKLAQKPGLLDRLFGSLKREIAKLTDRFRTAREQIDTIAVQLEDEVSEINHGLAVLDKLFEQQVGRFRELTLHVQAGHEVLSEYRNARLPEHERAASALSDSEGLLAGQQLRDLRAGVDRLDRKVLNLEKSRSIALALMPVIRQTQQTGITLVEELRMAITHALPAWKSAMIVHIEQLRHRHGLDTLGAMRDFTNEQLRAMAAELDSNVERTHAQQAEGIADTQAIVDTMNSLMRTLDKVERFEAEAAGARQASRTKLREAESAFRARLGDHAATAISR